MRVLYIPSWFPSSKNPLAGSFIKELAIDISNQEIEIIVAAFHQHYTELKGTKTKIEKISNSLKIYHHFGWTLPKINKSTQDYWIKKSIKSLNKLIEKYHFDFIHSHDYVSSFLALELSKQTEIPFICTMHHSDFICESIPLWRKDLLQEVFIKSLKTIVPSSALNKAIMRTYQIKDIITIPNYIDSSKIKAKVQLKKLPEKLIAVSSNEKIKNNKQLVEFASKNSIYIDLYGTVEKQIKSTKFVSVKGPIPHNELLNLYHHYDGFISMSTVETFGLSIMEALGAGLPVLINNTSGSSDFVNNLNGIQINDYEITWKDFLLKYHSFSSEVIRNNITSIYDKNIIIDKYISLYRKIYSGQCVV